MQEFAPDEQYNYFLCDVEPVTDRQNPYGSYIPIDDVLLPFVPDAEYADGTYGNSGEWDDDLPGTAAGWAAITPPDILQRARNILASTVRSHEKMSARYALLQAHPEQRITVDTVPLRQIVPFLSFKCHPDCSVARDQAISGSDIDRAVVIVEEMPSPEAREVFVDELRRQGFRAYTQEEVSAIGAAEGDAARWAAQGAVINFRTVAEVEESVRTHPLYEQNLSVIAGSEVGDV